MRRPSKSYVACKRYGCILIRIDHFFADHFFSFGSLERGVKSLLVGSDEKKRNNFYKLPDHLRSEWMFKYDVLADGHTCASDNIIAKIRHEFNMGISLLTSLDHKSSSRGSMDTGKDIEEVTKRFKAVEELLKVLGEEAKEKDDKRKAMDQGGKPRKVMKIGKHPQPVEVSNTVMIHVLGYGTFDIGNISSSQGYPELFLKLIILFMEGCFFVGKKIIISHPAKSIILKPSTFF